MRRFEVIDADQRSPEWFAARLGRLTGSRAGDMLATIKSGEAAARRDLKMQLVCERITNQAQEDVFVNAAMQRGVECEPLAFAAYEAHTGQMVQRSGFLSHLDHMAGCSLDGHVGDFDGLVECKCPKSATHFRYLRDGGVPKEHVPQMLHNIWVTEAERCDFVSFDDRFPPALSLFVVRYQPSPSAVDDYEARALAFLKEVDTEVAAIRTMTNPRAVLAEAV